MKNLLGGIISSIIGSLIIVTILESTPSVYPDPFNSIALFLIGCTTLANSFAILLDINHIIPLLITWILIGIIVGVFSEAKWNSIRTAMWVGVCIATVSLIDMNLQDPSFWVSEARNITLLIHYIVTIITSMFSLLSAIPITIVVGKIRMEADTPIPDQIITECECGAVFNSRPLICSECGKSLDMS